MPEDLVPSSVDVIGNDLVLPPGKVKGVTAGTAPDEATNRAQLDAEAARALAAEALLVPKARTVTAGAGLTGGGDLSANRTLAVVVGTTAGTVAAGDDPRFASGGGGEVPASRTLGFAGPAFVGAGDLSADRVIAPVFSDQAGTFCEGDDPRLTGGGSGGVPTTRQVIAGVGLTGGGDLSVDRTLTVAYGATATTACVGNDSRLTNTRTPTSHAASHAGGGADAIAIATTSVAGLLSGPDKTKLDALPATSVPTTRTVTSGAGLTGGGDLSANRSFACSFGTAASTVCEGNDTRVVNAVQTSRQVIAGVGLTGGGTLAADRTLAVSFGATATTACVGNDSRLVAAAAHALDTANPHAVTATQIGAVAIRDALLAVGCELMESARAVLTGVLPAHTASGSMVAGTCVLTMDVNGALPSSLFGGVTLITGDRVLIAYNDTDPTKAGPFDVVQGTPGSKASLSQSPGFNTAAALQGSTFRIKAGLDAGLWLCAQETIDAFGTQPLLWMPAGKPDSRYGFYAASSFSENSASRIVGAATGNQAILDFYCGFMLQGSAAGAGLQNASDGSGGLTTGTTTTGVGQLVTQTFNPTELRYVAEFSARFAFGTASDGTNGFNGQLGLVSDASNFSKISLIPTVGAAINHTTMVGGVAGATVPLGTLAIGTVYRYVLRKAFYSAVWSVWFDPGTGKLAYVADTPPLPATVSLAAVITKTLGPLARLLTLHDISARLYDPKVLGA